MVITIKDVEMFAVPYNRHVFKVYSLSAYERVTAKSKKPLLAKAEPALVTFKADIRSVKAYDYEHRLNGAYERVDLFKRTLREYDIVIMPGDKIKVPFNTGELVTLSVLDVRLFQSFV
jgi:hypothetical protein